MRKEFVFLDLLLSFIFFSGLRAENPILPDKYKKWIEEEVVYIITPGEKKVFFKLETDHERELFIEEFWRHRDPTPGTPRNEFKEEHYRRIEYVNTTKMWGQTKLKNAWRTDRGRIYIILGKPNYIERFNSSEIYPIEIWYYQGEPMYGQAPIFRILFFQRYGAGEFEIYNPIADGPRSLSPLTLFCEGCSTDDDRDRYAYRLISENVSPELAEASLSSFPGQNRWDLRLPSTILIGEVHTYPHKKVQDDYAYDFLEHKATVEVSYSIHHMGNQSTTCLLQEQSGIFFLNYAIEPETLSVDFYQDKYFTNLKISIRVADFEEKTIFQQERNFPIELKKEQLKKTEKRPFHLYNSFPLIPGNYKFNLLLENMVSKEFTSLEKDIFVPEPESFLLSSLILANKVDEDSPYRQFNKAFKIGNIQVYPSIKKIFSQNGKLYLFFQIYGLSQKLEDNGISEFIFYRDDQNFLKISKKLNEYENKRDFLQEFSLEKFPPGRYTLRVSLINGEGKELLSEQEEFTVILERLTEPWIISQANPPSDDPSYKILLGNQLFNKGEIEKARDELEKAYESNTESIDFALNYVKVLLALQEYQKIKEVLIPFLDKPVDKFIIYRFLAIAHQALEEYDKALCYYKEYISHEGASFEVLNSMALCFYQLGDENQALKAWEKSLEINPHQEGIKEVIKILKERDKNKKR